jgi:hypothetical protein
MSFAGKPNKELRVEFEGQIQMVDVNTLMSCLLNTSTIIEEINKELAKDLSNESKLQIQIKPFEKGSFDIIFCLADAQIMNGISKMFSADTLGYLSNIITILTGLFQVKQFIGGVEPEQLKSIDKGENIEIVNSTGSIHVDKRTYNIYIQNSTVNDSLNNCFNSLGDIPNIDSYNLYDENNNKLIEIKRDEFKAMSEKNKQHEQYLNINSTTKIVDKGEVKLTVIKLDFEKNKWSFYYEGNRINAKITDKNFFVNINNYSFKKASIITAYLTIIQNYNNDYGVYENKEYLLTQIRNIDDPPIQKSLF